MTNFPSENIPVFAADFSDGGNGYVRCPQCAEIAGLHMDVVEVHSAGGQRLEATAMGEDDNGRIALILDNSAASAGRRHRIELHWWCELCGGKSSVTFRQHKGVTEVIVGSA